MIRCPDLQALVERAGRRHAESIGEEYVEDPLKRPQHQGGFAHITPEEWAAWGSRQQGMAGSEETAAMSTIPLDAAVQGEVAAAAASPPPITTARNKS